jgi:uncharacterized protein (DUF2267 family)
MTTTGLETIDHSVHVTNEWLKDLSNLMDWEDRHRSWRLLRAVLHALRDWLQVNEAVHLGAQMPTLVRGLYYEGWHPAGTPVKKRSRADFRARIDKAFETDPLGDPDDAISAVFVLLSRHISKGEVADVRQSLPKNLRDLWPR